MKIIFSCCDMGETNALIPVMKELEKRGIAFSILAMGAAIRALAEQETLGKRVIVVKEEVDTVKARGRPLETVPEIISGLDPLIVISGPASKAQEQLLQALPAKKKIVYLDNFNYAVSNPVFEVAKNITSEANKVICVSDIVKEQILAINNENLKDKDIKVLGRPSLETWVQRVLDVDKTDALNKVGFSQDRGVVTFIGGYGPLYNAGVNEAYELARLNLEAAGYQVHMQHHPNLVKQQVLSPIEAVGMADVIVCYDSTVGFEALFAGKKVIYLDPENIPRYENIATQKGLASYAKPSEMASVISAPAALTPDIYKELGVTKDSTAAVTSYILKKFNKVQM